MSDNKFECEEIEVTVEGREFMFDGACEWEYEAGEDSEGFIDPHHKVRDTFTFSRVVEYTAGGPEDGTPVDAATLSDTFRKAFEERIRDEMQARHEEYEENRADRR